MAKVLVNGRKFMNVIKEMNESVKGTMEYGKYQMELEAKNHHGNWFFLGWSIPQYNGDIECYIKTIKGNSYMYFMSPVIENRFLINERVSDLVEECIIH